MTGTPQEAARALREYIAGVFESFVATGEARLSDFLAEIEDDISELWTVPAERQERFLRRMELQVMGLLELQRIETVQTTRKAVARSIVLGFQLLLRFLSPV